MPAIPIRQLLAGQRIGLIPERKRFERNLYAMKISQLAHGPEDCRAMPAAGLMHPETMQPQSARGMWKQLHEALMGSVRVIKRERRVVQAAADAGEFG